MESEQRIDSAENVLWLQLVAAFGFLILPAHASVLGILVTGDYQVQPPLFRNPVAKDIHFPELVTGIDVDYRKGNFTEEGFAAKLERGGAVLTDTPENRRTTKFGISLRMIRRR